MTSENRYDLVIIGAGFAGIAQGISLLKNGINNFIILEKASDLGGTWRANTYPGAECDIPSALYSFSFESYPKWEYKWSHQDQILDYLKYCADKYQLSQKIIFNQELVSALWNEATKTWKIKCKNNNHFHARSLVTAIGQLHHTSVPAFKNKELFQGHSWHSAAWDHTYNIQNKKVAVIGNAASAIQFVPQIAPHCQQLTIFQRSANWMLHKQDRLYQTWEKKLVARFPLLLKVYRAKLYTLASALYFLMKKDTSLFRTIYQNISIRYIKRKIKNPILVKQLIPDYPMGAKRILFSDDYYDALNLPHVSLCTDAIASFYENGILTTSGEKLNFDAVIYATGFKTNPFLLNIELKGNKGISISEKWKKGSVNYKGISVSDFPNFFMLYGPNTNLGHNSIIIMLEAQANYISSCIMLLNKHPEKSLDVKEEKMNQYYHHIQERLKNMIWTSLDKSWYISANGVAENNYPGRTSEYQRLTKAIYLQDYKLA